MNLAWDAAALRRFRCFEGIDDQQLAVVAGQFRIRRIGAGEALFRQGDRGDVMYLLLAGQLELTIEVVGSEDRAIATLEPGAVLGEISYLTNEPRTAAATAKTEVELLELSRVALQLALERGEAWAMTFLFGMAQTLARRLSSTDRDIAGLIAALRKGLGKTGIEKVASQLDGLGSRLTTEWSVKPRRNGDGRDDEDTLRPSASDAPIAGFIRELYEKYKPLRDGAVATYIPELAKANPDWFGISVATVDGRVFEIGDCQQPFTIQSISKPFVYALALEQHGRERVLEKVGVEPTGDAFNAIILDQESNRPFNPMVNAGAIATADLIQGATAEERLRQILEMMARYTGRTVSIDTAVFQSEKTTGHRNRAIAHLMLNFGMVQDQVEESLDLYFQQCSVSVTSRDLAVMAATIANGGVNPVSKDRALASRYIKDILSVMYTCGMYNYAGEWAYRIGLPAKSGVAGGILAVIPEQMGIGVFSPLLDSRGNSLRGIKVCEELSERFKLHCFDLRTRGDQLRESLLGQTQPLNPISQLPQIPLPSR